MRYSKLAVMLLSVVALAACSEGLTDTPTAPEVAPAFVSAIATNCDAAYFAAVSSQQDALFSGLVLARAKKMWNDVRDVCAPTTMPSARDHMLVYVRFTLIAVRKAMVLGSSPQQGIVDHWNSVFPYVGYPAPGLPATVLGIHGAAKVVRESEPTTEFGVPETAAMTVYKQTAVGVPGGHLFTIHPAPQNCLGATNLVRLGPCFEFSSFPKATVAFNPKVKLGICVVLGSTTSPALGHLTNVGVAVVDPDAVGVYPSTAYCHNSQTLPQFGGFTQFLKQFANASLQAFTVREAFAAHGGLGGVTESLSPFGAIERRIFSAKFNSDALGSTPPQDAIGFPDIGIWSKVLAQAPASILVEASLGSGATVLNKPVVLRYAGGSLDLWGEARTSGSHGAVASSGVYSIRWRSVVGSATFARAPFVIRSTEGFEVARLTYLKTLGVNSLTYNGITIPVAWTQGVSQSFVITVNLATRLTSLAVDGVTISVAQNQPISTHATNLHRIQAEFTGADSGVVGWDDIEIERLPDQ